MTCSATARRRSRWPEQVSARADAQRPGRQPNPVARCVTTSEPALERSRRPRHQPRLRPAVRSPQRRGERRVRRDRQHRRSAQRVPGDAFDPDLLTRLGPPADATGSSRRACSTSCCRASRSTWATSAASGRNFQVTDNLLRRPRRTSRSSTSRSRPTRGCRTAAATRSTGSTTSSRQVRAGRSNLNTLSDKYGKQIEHWNGVDFSVNARLQNGLTLQGGVEHRQADRRQLRDRGAAAGDAQPRRPTARCRRRGAPAQFCHRETPFLTAVKALAIYMIPNVDVQVSGSFRSTPAGARPRIRPRPTPSWRPTRRSAGRCPGGAANIVIGIEANNKLYSSAVNELDMRIGKVLRFGKSRSVVSLDIYNALNSDAMINQQRDLCNMAAPTEILNARLMKFSVAFDY